MDYSKLEFLVKSLKTNTDLCGICHLNNNNLSTTLPCNHKYHWKCVNNYIIQNKELSHICPYCSKKFNIKKLVKKCKICTNKTYFDLNKCDKHINCNKKCTIILKSGKRKNQPCNRYVKENKNYCFYHCKKNNENIKLCCAILKSGKRKNQLCSRKVHDKFNFCKLHYNYIEKYNNIQI